MSHWPGVVLTVTALFWPALASANKLAEIYELALERDAEYAAARAAYQAGREAWPQARASVLPSVSITGSYTEVDREIEATPFSGGDSAGPATPFSDEFGSETYGLEIRQPLFNWGIPATLRRGRTQVDIAELQFLAAKQSLLARVLSGYVNFLAAQASLDLTQAEKKAIAVDLNRTEARFEVGEISVTALRQAQAALDLAESRIISARAELDRERETLRRFTQEWYETLPDVPTGFDPDMPEPRDIQPWVSRTLDLNPEYLVALRQADMAEDEIQQARADYIPDLAVVAGYQEADDTEFVFGGASNETRIALEATWTLYAGGRNLSEARQASALYDQAQAEAENAARNATADTRNAYRQVATALRRLEALDQAVSSARTALESVQAEFQVGELTQADVIDARRDLFSALIDRTQARYDFATAATDLRRSAGVIAEEDLLRIDALLVEDPELPEEAIPLPE